MCRRNCKLARTPVQQCARVDAAAAARLNARAVLAEELGALEAAVDSFMESGDEDALAACLDALDPAR